MGGWGLKNIFRFAESLAAKGAWRLIKKDSLWSRVIFQKYIRPDTLEDWIRNPRKEHGGGSIIWKAVIKSFHVLDSHLAWDVGNGGRLRIGEDPWVGCEQQHILPRPLIEQLRDRGIFYLSQLVVPNLDRPWAQSWRHVDSLGLEDQDARELDRYIRELSLAHIHLKDRDDEIHLKDRDDEII